MANHLQNEYSPYLLQHANNPVNWYPWGEAAFEKARREKKAIFVSIGYSACHWCHVMEQESFSNEETAKLLNEHFVAIKVDREERPDIDKHFQAVYQLMNQRPGGWPTSIFLTEDQKPFYSATYIPDEPRYGMMSFNSLLSVIAEKYQKEQPLLTEKAEEILRFLNPNEDTIEATKLDASILNRLIEQAEQLYDHQHGGFNTAPKFPQTSLLDLLLDLSVLTHNEKSLTMVTDSLIAMARGGLRDLIDGGFCRYSTDNAWCIPHFEKMAYDNAQLAALYLKAYQVTGEPFFQKVSFETINFMLDKMSEEGLFYSASDADSEGQEGKYFVYSYEKVIKSFSQAGIPEDAHHVLLQLLNVTKKGNFEGKNILHLDDPIVPESTPYYHEAIQALKQRRAKRTYPSIDKKILLSWNAMMVTTLFKAAKVEPKYLSHAKKSLSELLDRMYLNGELFHTTLIGKTPKIKAFLEDYAYLSETLIEAYQATLDETYLITATKLANNAIEKYYIGGKWKFSRGEFETHADIYDNSYPSSLATMLWVLHSIASLVDVVYKKFVFKSLEIHSYDVMRQPISSPKMSHMVVRYLFDDVILKAKEEKLLAHIKRQRTLAHPFTLYKNDSNDGFMLCNSHSCFAHEKSFEAIEQILIQRMKRD